MSGSTKQRSRKTSSRSTKARSRVAAARPSDLFIHHWMLYTVEMLGLIFTALIAVMVLLGYTASWFTGTDFLYSLLPFAAGVLGLILATALLLIIWWKVRSSLRSKALILAPLFSLSVAVGFGWFLTQNTFNQPLAQFRKLVGGVKEARRIVLAHQVYAAYRRFDLAPLRMMLERSDQYSSEITEAAAAFDIDPDLLHGLAATESSFLPRDSKDGGKGLFQITLAPKAATKEAGRHLSVNPPSLNNIKHNAFVAAATFKHYLKEMNGDMFLGLLAYNIGPANGGLRFIMDQYGAKDFVTIQPYLKELPREYPIRVLSYALAFRLWHLEGRLPPYEEEDNAQLIQSIGIPGLS